MKNSVDALRAKIPGFFVGKICKNIDIINENSSRGLMLVEVEIETSFFDLNVDKLHSTFHFYF